MSRVNIKLDPTPPEFSLKPPDSQVAPLLDSQQGCDLESGDSRLGLVSK